MASAAQKVLSNATELVSSATVEQATYRVGRILTAERASGSEFALTVDVGWREPEICTIISALSVEQPEKQLPGLLVIVGCFNQRIPILDWASDGLLLTTYQDPERQWGMLPLPAPEGVPVGGRVREQAFAVLMASFT